MPYCRVRTSPGPSCSLRQPPWWPSSRSAAWRAWSLDASTQPPVRLALTTVDPWHRAIAFIRAVDERAAEQVVPFRWGRALINRRLDLVHDLNYLLVDRTDG